MYNISILDFFLAPFLPCSRPFYSRYLLHYIFFLPAVKRQVLIMGKVWSLAKSRNGTLIILITVVSSASLTLRKFIRELPIFQFPVLLTKFFSVHCAGQISSKNNETLQLVSFSSSNNIAKIKLTYLLCAFSYRKPSCSTTSFVFLYFCGSSSGLLNLNGSLSGVCFEQSIELRN